MENNQKNSSINLGAILNPSQNANNFSSSMEIRLDQCVNFFLKGKRSLDKNEIDPALKLFEQAISCLKPEDLTLKDNSIYFSYLGLAMQKKGWNSFAQARFKEALKIDPTDAIALEGLKSIPSTEKNNVKLNDVKHDKINTTVGKLKSFFTGFSKPK